MNEPLFHVVNRKTAKGQGELLNDVRVEDWPWVIYRRVSEPKDLTYGVAVGVFWNEEDARLICMACNAVRNFILHMTAHIEYEEDKK